MRSLRNLRVRTRGGQQPRYLLRVVLCQSNCCLHFGEIHVVNHCVCRRGRGQALHLLQGRAGLAAQRQRKGGVGNRCDRVIQSQSAVSSIARGSTTGGQRVVHRLQGIEASRRVGEVLLLSPQRGMFPLLAGDMNPSGEEVDVACQILHRETGGLSGGPLQLLLPVRVAG